MTKYCKNCLRELTSKDKRRKFCSRSCSTAYTNKNSELHKQSVGESLKKSIKLKNSKRKLGLERRDVQRILMLGLWARRKQEFRDKISKSIVGDVVSRRSKSISLNSLRKEKIRSSLIRFHTNNPNFWVSKGRVLRTNKIQKLFSNWGVSYRRNYKIQGVNFDFLLRDLDTLVLVCDESEFGYDREKDFSKSQLENIELLEEKVRVSKTVGYKLIIITNSAILKVKTIEDMASLSRDSRKVELLSTNINDHAILYGALPII